MLTGLLPVAHGLRQNGNGALPEETATLATALTASGAKTAAFVSAFVLNRRFGLASGFSTYDDVIPQRPGRPAGMEAQRPGRETVDRALAWLDEHAAGGGPLFVWVHLFDAHAPYEPPEPFATAFADPYDGEIAEADAQLGRLLGALDRRGIAPSTLVVVASDHGEALGEHGERSHGLLLYEPTVRVPWIVRGPGVAGGRVIRTPVSLVDLAPTVLELLGRPPLSVQGPRAGRSLAASLIGGGEPPSVDLYAETEYPRLLGWSPLAALRRGPNKYVDGPEPELFDLAADPRETTNRLDGERRIAASMRAGLAELRRDALDLAAAPLDAEALRALTALGYLGGAPADGGKETGRDPRRMVSLFVRLEKARNAMDAGQLEEAAAELSRLLEADPDNPVFRGTRATALGRLGRKGLAVDELRRSLTGGPGDLQTLYDLALAMRAAGLREESRATLDELLRRDPAHGEAWNARGLLALERGHQQEAIADFERAASLDAGNANAFSNLGNALRAAGRYEAAERALRRAIDLAPEWADPWNGLGALEVGRGRSAAGLEHFDRALALDPRRHEIRLNRAIALDALGRRGEAAAGYRDFLAVTERDRAFREQREVAEKLLARLAEG